MPVVVVGINTDQTNPVNTDNFIRNVGFDLVLDDPTWKTYAQFGPGSSASRYVIINGLANSPSHRQWEVLFNQVSFQSRQPESVRAVIERVKPPVRTAPKLSAIRRVEGGGVEFSLTGDIGRNYHMEFSTDLRTWARVATLNATDTSIVYRDANAPATTQGYYRAVGE